MPIADVGLGLDVGSAGRVSGWTAGPRQMVGGGWSGVQGRREVLDNSWPPPSLLRLSKLWGSGGPPNRWEAEPLSSWGK